MLSATRAACTFSVLPKKRPRRLCCKEAVRVRRPSSLRVLIRGRIFTPKGIGVYRGRRTNFSLRSIQLRVSSCKGNSVHRPFIRTVLCSKTGALSFHCRSTIVAKGGSTLSKLPNSCKDTKRIRRLYIAVISQRCSLGLLLCCCICRTTSIVKQDTGVIGTDDRSMRLAHLVDLRLSFSSDSCVFAAFHNT